MRLLILFGVLLLPVTNYGQKSSLILQDKVSGRPVEFAHVLSQELNTANEEHSISNEEGLVEFSLQLPLVIHISSLGFQDYVDTIYHSGKQVITLSPEYYQFDKVVVTGQFRPQSLDNSIYKIDILFCR